MKSLPLLLLASVLVSALAATEPALPQLRRQGTATQLIVDGKPFLIRGGELGNSSGEPAYLRPFWAKLKALNLNTVVAPVYWDQVEPAEGKFDFATVDGLVKEARAQDMRLVLLWFGTWKNSMSCYAPGWVKRDFNRFPRCRDSAGRPMEIVTPFSEEMRRVDARAFRALLRHLRETDGQQQTVVLVQVENEIGMIPEARDRSEPATRAFAAPVPAKLLQYLGEHADALAPELRELWLAQGRKTAGSWTEVFGPGVATDELFMAWHFAEFVEAVTAEGKAEYALPMYVNAALIRPGHKPGQYPSAGPLPHLIDVWRAGAPSIDFLSPDIYFTNFSEWMRRYTRGGNPLFIPEAMRSPDASVNGLFAFAEGNAIGFSPFGIESVEDPAARYLTESYALVAQLTPLILQHQGHGTMVGLLPEGPEQRQPQQTWLGGYVLHTSFEKSFGPSLADGAVTPSGNAVMPAGGLVIATGPDEFLLAGTGITMTFQQRAESDRQVGLLSVEEGTFVNGEWQHLRWLNGDEVHQGRHARIAPGRFGILRVKVYQYR